MHILRRIVCKSYKFFFHLFPFSELFPGQWFSVNSSLKGFEPILDDTGKITGYKTEIGGADTVFPFSNPFYNAVNYKDYDKLSGNTGYTNFYVDVTLPQDLNGNELFIYSYRQGVFDGVSLSIVSGAIKYELVTDFKEFTSNRTSPFALYKITGTKDSTLRITQQYYSNYNNRVLKARLCL